MNTILKQISILTIVIIVVFSFFWLAIKFSGEGTMNEEPRIICKKSKYNPLTKECFITAHIHATLHIFKNNKEISLGYETGNLDRNHTHAQSNIMHWHGLVPTDNNHKEELSFAALSQFDEFKLSNIIEDFKLSYKSNPRFIANGTLVDSSYHWKADDSIEVYYD